uniref:Uncharacterized protein n=1 Tax=Nothoprocta perdicaria TaxID=30464 RepID=A0A8C7E8U2_NOTPE
MLFHSAPLPPRCHMTPQSSEPFLAFLTHLPKKDLPQKNVVRLTRALGCGDLNSRAEPGAAKQDGDIDGSRGGSRQEIHICAQS